MDRLGELGGANNEGNKNTSALCRLIEVNNEGNEDTSGLTRIN